MATGARTIDTPDRPPLTPVKGEALSLASSAIGHVIRTQRAYLCPKSDGRLVIGATERAGESNLTPDLAEISALRSRAEIVVPGLRTAREISSWAGIRPGTPDGAPILGAAPDWPGLFYALGGYRNGVLQAPLVSRLLVDLMISNLSDRALETFSARRFQAASTRN
jgi:glycine oxidase